MNTSSNGAKFIACREALVGVAYVDGKHEDGLPKYSIGFGSQTPPVQPGDTITVEAAFARLRADLDYRDMVIARAIIVPIKQQEWDAVASLYYQSGSKALSTVAGLFNLGFPEKAMDWIMLFNSGADGIPTTGHTKRRKAEQALGRDGDYGDISQFQFFDGEGTDKRKWKRKWMPFPDTI